jgi:rhodanese-related sulfurtransferase
MTENLAPREAQRLAREEGALLVDVREPEEYARLRIPGAVLQPLSVLPLLPEDGDRAGPAVYFCASGGRTGGALDLLEARGHARTCILEGGLEAWRRAGLPVEESRGAMPLMRQVRIVAGGLILVFLIAGQFLPLFRLLAGGVGLGLLVSGLTGACGMAALLRRMPWNREGRVRP